MAHSPCSISETDFTCCPEINLATYGHDCEEFDEDCTPINVYDTVTRGKQLRECKPVVQFHDECYVGVDYDKPCPEKRSQRKFYHHRPCYDIYNSPCAPPQSPPCGCCPQTSSVRSKSCKRSKTSLSHHKQCPLRIMELAAPTKRHCLETWRSKAHILPDYMLDRVRRQVMDEKALVEIPDALNCFKKRVSNRSSRSRKSRRSDACMSDVKRYSAIFAHCVAQKLDKPLNITLNPELEKISRVISYEISRVTKKGNKKGTKSNKKSKFENQMQDEMSKKVTAWIDNVLIDTSGKILEDDLRELEEEEGPVLDIIDDLINRVVDISEPEDTKYDTAEDETDNYETREQKSATFIDTDETRPTDGDGDIIDLSIEDYLKNEIYQEIDKMTSKDEDTLYYASNDLYAQIDGIEGNIRNITHVLTDAASTVNDNLDNIADDVTNSIDNLGTEIEKINDNTENFNLNKANNALSQYALEQITDNDALDTSEKDIDNENNAEIDDMAGEMNNVSDLFKNSEGSLDDDKTVTFSNVANDTGGIEQSQLKRQKLRATLDEDNERHKSASQQSNNIIFAVPNEHLLSEADELWPDELRPKPSKLSATVSKSVMSLGFISENEEKMEPESSKERTPFSYTYKPDGDTTIESAEYALHDLINPIPEMNEFSQFSNEELENLKIAILEQKVADVSKIKTDLNKNVNLEIIHSVLSFDGTKDESVFPEYCQIKFNERKKKVDHYKVDMRTAPSWVVTGHCEKGRGEPEDILAKYRHEEEYDLDVGDFRIWIKNLETICTNLIIWNAWIETTCKNIKHIKRKSERNRYGGSYCCRQKDIDFWKKLERYINKDAVFWLKLKHCTKRKLRTYKYLQAPKKHETTTDQSAQCKCKIFQKMQCQNARNNGQVE